MAYTTPSKVRLLLGIEESDSPDDILNQLIEEATNVVISRITAKILDEEPIPSPTGNPKEIYLSQRFIADTNGDQIVDKNDIHVYVWEEQYNEDTKTEVEVDSLNPLTGRVVLKESPEGKYITVDYSYYLNKVDWNLIDLATAYYTAKLWVERELLLVPKKVRVGRTTLQHHDYWKTLRREFERIIHLIVVLPMDKVEYEKMVKSSRGTTLKEEI